MKQLTNVLIGSALAGLLTVLVCFLLAETGYKPSFASGAIVGGGLASMGIYLRQRRSNPES